MQQVRDYRGGCVQVNRTDAVLCDLKRLMQADQAQQQPVFKAVSLTFWDQAKTWVQHLTTVPYPFTVAIGGGSGSGKSAVRDILVDELSKIMPVSSFTQDNYYRNFSQDFPDVSVADFYHWVDFDDPAHVRFDRLADDMQCLKQAPLGSMVPLPKLIYGTPEQKPTVVEHGQLLEATPVIITEGIHALSSSTLLPLYHLKIYVDVNEATRRQRWLDRNQKENRGTTDNMWQTTVRCMEHYIYPSRSVADLVLNNQEPECLERLRDFLAQFLAVLCHQPVTSNRKAVLDTP